MLIGRARLVHRLKNPTEDASNPRAGCRSGKRGGEPAGCHDRTDTGNSKYPQTGQKARPAADHSANAGTGTGAAANIGGLGQFPMAVIPVLRDDCDVIVGHSGLEVANSLASILMVVVQKRYSFGHVILSLSEFRWAPFWKGG